MAHLNHEYLSMSADRFPNSIAVKCQTEEITYAELDNSTNAFARELKSSGLERGEFVPFFIEKSIEAIQAIFSISKADCAYIPLDTSSPSARIISVIRSAKASLVLVDNESEATFVETIQPHIPNLQVLNINALQKKDCTPLKYENLSIDIAYVLFTSGSTGAPKGVMISHQMIVDYIDWCAATYQISETDRVANHAPLFFDNSTFDIYCSISSGAELHLVYDALNKVMPKLIPWIEQNGITVFFCVPSVLSILKRTKRVTAERLKSLRHVIAAGEVLQREVADYWMETLPDIQLTNMYGPTEITVDCTFHVLLNGAEGEDVPIGAPRKNMEVFVRLEDGSLSVEPGAVGEISVRGMSVSYGYLNDPEKTATAFIQNPKHALYHDPIYLTGDRGRIGPEGELYYIGRLDQQIKYMGHRIELGEIENTLRQLEGVVDAAVIFSDGATLEEKYIGALVILERKTIDNLKAEAENRLPSYMHPKVIVSVKEFPLTANGKVDRGKALELVKGKSS